MHSAPSKLARGLGGFAMAGRQLGGHGRHRFASRAPDGVSTVAIWHEKAGLTQRALAKSAEVSVTYLSEIEAGKKPGSAETLRTSTETLRVPMEVLVG
jgi:antitoxin component HigA of HigAB toxin-antitoxin module